MEDRAGGDAGTKRGPGAANHPDDEDIITLSRKLQILRIQAFLLFPKGKDFVGYDNRMRKWRR